MKRLLCFLILVFPVMGFAQSGYINTIAGTTTAGFGGDGGRASAAVFSGVLDVIYDAVGNIYVADNGNRRIRKIDPSGIITTVVGGGTSAADSIPATNARINISTGAGLCEDNTGNLYFCDSNRVRKVDVATGIVTTVAGTGYQGFRGDGGPATAAWLSNPNGVCFDRRGNMYIGDRSNGCVRKVDTRGIISTFAGGIGIGYRGDGGPATAALLNSPATMCFDAAGNLYVADIYNFRIRKIDVAGTITTFAGTGRSGCSGDGGPATVAEIGAVQYLSIDNYDNLYFSDPYNGRIRMIDCFGRVRTVAGGGSLTASGSLATAASISAKGVEIDACGNIYVGNGNIVSKVDPVIDSPTALADTFSAWVTPYCGGLSFY